MKPEKIATALKDLRAEVAAAENIKYSAEGAAAEVVAAYKEGKQQLKALRKEVKTIKAAAKEAKAAARLANKHLTKLNREVLSLEKKSKTHDSKPKKENSKQPSAKKAASGKKAK